MSNPPVFKGRRPAAVLASLAMLILGNANAATTLTIRPDGTNTNNADAFVTTGPSNNLTGINYGAAGALAVSGATARGTFESVIRMDVSSAIASLNSTYGAGQWVLDSIKLELTASTVGGNNPVLNSPNVNGNFNILWFGNDTWTEGTGTPMTSVTTGVKWADISTLTSGAQSQGTFAYTGTGTSLYTLSGTAGLLSDLYAGTLMSFYLTAADSTLSALFNSQNNGVAANRPALVITASAVPEPGRAMLLVIGGVVVMARRRRNTSNNLYD